LGRSLTGQTDAPRLPILRITALLNSRPQHRALGKRFKPLTPLPKMTQSEIARRRLNAYIEVHGYNFPEFIELSLILFAPENPSISAQ